MQPSHIADRFWTKVHKTDGCWLWTGAVSNRYGAFKPFPRQPIQRAHRMAWVLMHGSIPDGASVCHHCDTPTCVNPSHLFLGSQADNLRDMSAKGRGRGSVKSTLDASGLRRNHNAKKLLENDVREIRRRSANGEHVTALAREFRVSHPAIVRIVQRATWRWIEESMTLPTT